LESAQNAAKATRQGAAEHLKEGYYLTLLSEATKTLLGKRPECSKSCLESAQNGAKASRQGAAEHLKEGHCLTLFSEATRTLFGKRPECCKSCLESAQKGGYCLTLLPEDI